MGDMGEKSKITSLYDFIIYRELSTLFYVLMYADRLGFRDY